MQEKNRTVGQSLSRVVLGVALALSTTVQAASHREAPLTALDHKADITDFFAFVSYDDPDKVTFILNVDPLLEPSNGPNYFPFDPDITYAIRIDNNHDALEDIVFTFRFGTDVTLVDQQVGPESDDVVQVPAIANTGTEIRLPGVFTGFVGAGMGIPAPANSPAPVAPGTLIVPPAITALDGPGSEGLSLRQSYTVTMVKRTNFPFGNSAEETIFNPGQRLFAVPSNVGPRTMPDYPALADQGIYALGNSVRVFAGTVEDPFWIDLGAAFDSLNFRAAAFDTGVPGVLGDMQDADDSSNYAADDVAGFNVNAIAIEVPIAMITAGGTNYAADQPFATIGSWGTTSRSKVRIINPPFYSLPTSSGPLVQIQRMGNPLFNELIIGTGDKDRFSMSRPHSDAQFADYALDPVLARVLNAIYETTVGAGTLPIPAPPRLDLLPLVQYMPPIAAAGTSPGPVADLLRLNTGIPATAATNRSRLGLLGGDGAGYPNGRRVSDDVTDIAARVVAGVLAGPPFDGFPHNRIGDGVNVNDVPYRETFPYLGYAHSGRDSRHVDPGELGCLGSCP